MAGVSRKTVMDLCRSAARWRSQDLVRSGFATRAVEAAQERNAVPQSFGSSSRSQVKVPKRINRHPAAVLEVLASTVGRDPTAPHYRFMDDPFFIPSNSLNKRAFALSKESGRKAARYMIKRFPDIVEKPHAAPTIPAFLASSIAEPQIPENCTERDLITFMDSGALSAATTVWRKLKKDGLNIPLEIEEELLERLCFTNSNSVEPDQEGLLEEQWYVHYLQKDMHPKWKINGLADEVFNGMQTKSPAAYSAVICGMAKYLAVDNANSLFTEMEQQNIPMPLDVFNAMISLARYLRDTTESRWELTISMLSKMDDMGVAPNLQTFNNVLDVVSRVGMWKRGRELALHTVAEMERCGVEPSLTTFYYLLNIFCRERGPISHILYDILPYIENNKWSVQDARDVLFWPAAMEIVYKHMQDPDAAKRLQRAFTSDNNTSFIVDAHKEQMYYNSFFKVLVAGETVDKFMEYYDDLVPMTFTPDVASIVEIMRMLESHERLDLLPRIWSDAAVFGFALKENIVDTVLEIMLTNGNEKLNKQFSIIAKDIQDRVNKQSEDRVQRLSWTGQRCGAISSILLRFGLIDDAWSALNMYIAKHEEIFGVPSPATFNEIVDALLVQGKINIPKIRTILRLTNELGFADVGSRVEEIIEKLGLGNEEGNVLRSAAGVPTPAALRAGLSEE